MVWHKSLQVIMDPMVTFPLVLGPDPCTAVVVDPVEHLSHPAEVPAPIHREEKEDGTLSLPFSPGSIQPLVAMFRAAPDLVSAEHIDYSSFLCCYADCMRI